VTVAGVLFVCYRTRGRSARWPIAAAIIGSLLVSHYLNGLDYMLLAIPVWLMAGLGPRWMPLASAGLWIGTDVAFASPAITVMAAALALAVVVVVSSFGDGVTFKLFAEWRRKRSSTP
jgi:thiol:disulfide interchange protein